MVDFDIELFKGKTFSELMKDVYDNSKKKERQINLLIAELKPLIKNVGDATLIVPLIKEYLEVGVKNDEHLVKLAAVVQRLISSNARAVESTGSPYMLSEEEKQQLLAELNTIENADLLINNKIVDLAVDQKQLDPGEENENI
jgi:hypothetical protein